MKIKHFLPVKITAWFLSVLMLLSGMGDGSLLYALPSSSGPSAPSANFVLKELEVPENFGEVSEKFEAGQNKPAVILIQDAHAIPDAQKNLHALIRFFEKKYGVKNVALEGASSQLDPQFFRSFPDPKLLKKIFKDYYERAELSGAAAASVFAGTDVRFQGVEDWSLYEQALADYSRALESESALLARLKTLRTDLESFKQKNYSPELLKADQAWEAFEKNHTQILETIQVFSKIQKPSAGSLMELLLRVDSQEKSNQGEISELKAAAEAVREVLEKNAATRKKELMELNRCLQAYQTGEMNAQEFAVRIKKMAEGLDMALRFSRPLRELSLMQMRLESIRGTKLLKEFEAYAASVKKELMSREIDVSRQTVIRTTERKSLKIRLLEKLTRLELSHDEWIKVQSMRSGSSGGEEGEPDLIDWNLFEAHISFYEKSIEREKAFMRNLRKLMSGQSDDLRPAVFVAGGFHTQGMAERFKKEGLSYAVVTPKIERLPEENLYRKHMAGDVSWKSYFKVENNRVRPYDAFARSVRDQLLSQNSEVAKVWRDEIVRDLADLGRAQDAWKYTRFLDEKVLENGARPRVSEGTAERLSRRVDQFVSGLRSLCSSGNLNQQSVANLLRSMNAVAAMTGPAVMEPNASVSIPSVSSSSVEVYSGDVLEAARKDYSEWISEIEKQKNDVQYRDFQTLAYRLSAADKMRKLNRMALYDFWSALREEGNAKWDDALSNPELLNRLITQKVSAVKIAFAGIKSAPSSKEARTYSDEKSAYVMRQAAQAMALMSVIEIILKNESESIKDAYGDWLRGLDSREISGTNLTEADVYRQGDYASFDAFLGEELGKNNGAGMRDEVLNELKTYGSPAPASWVFADEKIRAFSEELSKMNLWDLFTTARDHYVFEFDDAETALAKFIVPVRSGQRKIERLNHHFQVLRQDRNRLILREILYRWGSADRPRSHVLFSSRSEMRYEDMPQMDEELIQMLLDQGRFISILGAPGAGKGTLMKSMMYQLNKYLQDHNVPKGYAYLEIGEIYRGVDRLVRGEPQKGDEEKYRPYVGMVQDALEMMRNGLITETVTLDMVNFALAQSEYKDARGIFFDGFPRTLMQDEAINDGTIILGDNQTPLVAVLHVDRGKLLERTLRRNAQSARPDSSGTSEVQLQKFETRMKDFERLTQPLIDEKKSDPKTFIFVDDASPEMSEQESIEYIHTKFYAGLKTHLNQLRSGARDTDQEMAEAKGESPGMRDSESAPQAEQNPLARFLAQLTAQTLNPEFLLEAYYRGMITQEPIAEILRQFNLNPLEIDRQIQIAGENAVRKELEEGELHPLARGSQSEVYSGLIHGNEIVIKEVEDEDARRKYAEFQDILGDNVAGYLPIYDLTINLPEGPKVIPFAVIQEKVETLADRIARIKRESSSPEERFSEINEILKSYIDLYVRLLKLGFFSKPNGFLIDIGVTRNGRVVVLDVGDLLDADEYQSEYSRTTFSEQLSLDTLWRVHEPYSLPDDSETAWRSLIALIDPRRFLNYHHSVGGMDIIPGTSEPIDSVREMKLSEYPAIRYAESILTHLGITGYLNENETGVREVYTGDFELAARMNDARLGYLRSLTGDLFVHAANKERKDRSEVRETFTLPDSFKQSPGADAFFSRVEELLRDAKLPAKKFEAWWKAHPKRAELDEKIELMSREEFDAALNLSGQLSDETLFLPSLIWNNLKVGFGFLLWGFLRTVGYLLPLGMQAGIFIYAYFTKMPMEEASVGAAGAGTIYFLAWKIYSDLKSFFSGWLDNLKESFYANRFRIQARGFIPIIEQAAREILENDQSPRGPALNLPEDVWQESVGSSQRLGVVEIAFRSKYFPDFSAFRESYQFSEEEFRSYIQPFLDQFKTSYGGEERREILSEALKRMERNAQASVREILYLIMRRLAETDRYRAPPFEGLVRGHFEDEALNLLRDVLAWMGPVGADQKGREDIYDSITQLISERYSGRLPTAVYPMEWGNLKGIQDAKLNQLVIDMQSRASKILDIEILAEGALDRYLVDLSEAAQTFADYVSDSENEDRWLDENGFDIYGAAYAVLQTLIFLNQRSLLTESSVVSVFQNLLRPLNRHLKSIAEMRTMAGDAPDLELKNFGGNPFAARAALQYIDGLNTANGKVSSLILAIMINETNLFLDNKNPFRSESRTQNRGGSLKVFLSYVMTAGLTAMTAKTLAEAPDTAERSEGEGLPAALVVDSSRVVPPAQKIERKGPIFSLFQEVHERGNAVKNQLEQTRAASLQTRQEAVRTGVWSLLVAVIFGLVTWFIYRLSKKTEVTWNVGRSVRADAERKKIREGIKQKSMAIQWQDIDTSETQNILKVFRATIATEEGLDKHFNPDHIGDMKKMAGTGKAKAQKAEISVHGGDGIDRDASIYRILRSDDTGKLIYFHIISFENQRSDTKIAAYGIVSYLDPEKEQWEKIRVGFDVMPSMRSQRGRRFAFPVSSADLIEAFLASIPASGTQQFVMSEQSQIWQSQGAGGTFQQKIAFWIRRGFARPDRKQWIDTVWDLMRQADYRVKNSDLTEVFDPKIDREWILDMAPDPTATRVIHDEPPVSIKVSDSFRSEMRGSDPKSFLQALNDPEAEFVVRPGKISEVEYHGPIEIVRNRLPVFLHWLEFFGVVWPEKFYLLSTRDAGNFPFLKNLFDARALTDLISTEIYVVDTDGNLITTLQYGSPSYDDKLESIGISMGRYAIADSPKTNLLKVGIRPLGKKKLQVKMYAPEGDRFAGFLAGVSFQGNEGALSRWANFIFKNMPANWLFDRGSSLENYFTTVALSPTGQDSQKWVQTAKETLNRDPQISGVVQLKYQDEPMEGVDNERAIRILFKNKTFAERFERDFLKSAAGESLVPYAVIPAKYAARSESRAGDQGVSLLPEQSLIPVREAKGFWSWVVRVVVILVVPGGALGVIAEFIFRKWGYKKNSASVGEIRLPASVSPFKTDDILTALRSDTEVSDRALLSFVPKLKEWLEAEVNRELASWSDLDSAEARFKLFGEELREVWSEKKYDERIGYLGVLMLPILGRTFKNHDDFFKTWRLFEAFNASAGWLEKTHILASYGTGLALHLREKGMHPNGLDMQYAEKYAALGIHGVEMNGRFITMLDSELLLLTTRRLMSEFMAHQEELAGRSFDWSYKQVSSEPLVSSEKEVILWALGQMLDPVLYLPQSFLISDVDPLDEAELDSFMQEYLGLGSFRSFHRHWNESRTEAQSVRANFAWNDFREQSDPFVSRQIKRVFGSLSDADGNLISADQIGALLTDARKIFEDPFDNRERLWTTTSRELALISLAYDMQRGGLRLPGWGLQLRLEDYYSSDIFLKFIAAHDSRIESMKSDAVFHPGEWSAFIQSRNPGLYDLKWLQQNPSIWSARSEARAVLQRGRLEITFDYGSPGQIILNQDGTVYSEHIIPTQPLKVIPQTGIATDSERLQISSVMSRISTDLSADIKEFWEAVQDAWDKNPYQQVFIGNPVRSEMRLAENSKAEIEAVIDQAGGLISYAQFQELALYGKHGYYSAGGVRFSELGTDEAGVEFHTNAHLPAVGLALADHFYQVWKTMGEPEKFDIVELSGGDGSMALNVLQPVLMYESRYADAFWKSLHYKIVERNQVLIDRQKSKLKGLRQTMGSRLAFVHESALETNLPSQSVSGVVFSNELPDAFAVHRVIVRNGELKEIYVGYNENGFYEQEGDLNPETKSAIEAYFEVVGELPPEGKEFAVNLAMAQLQSEISRILKQGVALTMDYGFPQTQDRYHSDLKNAVWTFGDFDGVAPLKLGVDTTHNIDFETLQKMGAAQRLTQSKIEFLPYFLERYGFVGSTANPQEYVLIQVREIALEDALKGRSEMRLSSDQGAWQFEDVPVDLRQFYTPEVIDRLKEDSLVRPVYLVAAEQSQGSVGEFQPGNEAMLHWIGGTDILNSLTGFGVRSADEAELFRSRGFRIIVGITDRYDANDFYKVSNGRQVFVPVPGKKVWIGLKGVGQFKDPEKEIVYSSVRGYEGLVGADEAQKSQRVAHIPELSKNPFVINLGSRSLLKIPQRSGAFLPVSDLPEVYVPFIIYNLFYEPHRASKFKSIVRKDPQLFDMIRKRSWAAYQSINEEQPESAPEPAVWMNWIASQWGEAEGRKRSLRVVHETLKAQDLSFPQRADLEEIVTEEEHRKKILRSARGLTAVDLDEAIRSKYISSLANTIGILIDMEQDSREVPDFYARYFPDIQKTVLSMIQGYLRALDDELLAAWTKDRSLLTEDDPVLSLYEMLRYQNLKKIMTADQIAQFPDLLISTARGVKAQRARSEARSAQLSDEQANWIDEASALFNKGREDILHDSNLNPLEKAQELVTLADHYVSKVAKKFKVQYSDLPSMLFLAAGSYANREVAPRSDFDGFVAVETHADVEALKNYFSPGGFVFEAMQVLGGNWNLFAIEEFENPVTVRDDGSGKTTEPEIQKEVITQLLGFREVKSLGLTHIELSKRLRAYLQKTENQALVLEQVIDAWVEPRSEKGYFAGLSEREPDLKWGAGGLKDYDVARWAIRVFFENEKQAIEAEKGNNISFLTWNEFNRAQEAAAFIRKVRWILHSLQPALEPGEDPDYLGLEHQLEIAKQIYGNNLPDEELRKRFLHDLRKSQRVLYLYSATILRRALHKTGALKYFYLPDSDPGKYIFKGVERLKREGKTMTWDQGPKDVSEEILTLGIAQGVDADDLLKIFRYAGENNLRVTGELLDGMQKKTGEFLAHFKADEDFRAQVFTDFLAILHLGQSAGYILFRLHMLGILSELIPGFESLNYQVSPDFRYDHTLDMNSIRMVQTLDQLMGYYEGKQAQQGFAVGDLSQTGWIKILRAVLLAREILSPKETMRTIYLYFAGLQLTEHEAERATWLIQNQTALMSFIQNGGIYYPEDFINFQRDVLSDAEGRPDYLRWQALLAMTLVHIETFQKGRIEIYLNKLKPLLEMTRDEFENQAQLPVFFKAKIQLSQLPEFANGVKVGEVRMHWEATDTPNVWKLNIAHRHSTDKNEKLGRLFRIATVLAGRKFNIMALFPNYFANDGITVNSMIVRQAYLTEKIKEDPTFTEKLQNEIQEAFSTQDPDEVRNIYRETPFNRSPALAAIPETEVEIRKYGQSSFVYLKTPDGQGALADIAHIVLKHHLIFASRSTVDTVGGRAGLQIQDTIHVLTIDGEQPAENALKALADDLEFAFKHKVITDKVLAEIDKRIAQRSEMRLTVQEKQYISEIANGSRPYGRLETLIDSDAGETEPKNPLVHLFGEQETTLLFSGLIEDQVPQEWYRDKSVLVAPGYGNLPFFIRGRGAKKVVGLDSDPITVAFQKAKALFGNHSDLEGIWGIFNYPTRNFVQKDYLDRITRLVQAEEPTKATELDRIEFRVGNVLDLSQEQEKYDLVVVPYLMGVQHGLTPEQGDQMLSQFGNVLNQGGRIVLLPVLEERYIRGMADSAQKLRWIKLLEWLKGLDKKGYQMELSKPYSVYANMPMHFVSIQRMRSESREVSVAEANATRSEGRKFESAHVLLHGFQSTDLNLDNDEAGQQAGQVMSDVENVGFEEYLDVIQKLRDEMVKGLEGEQKKQMENLVRFFADALLQNSKSEIEIALDAPELEMALQQAIQEFAFGDGVRFVLPKTMANLKIPAAMVRRVNSLASAVKKGGPVLLSIFSAGGEGASQKSENIVDLISDEKNSYGLNEIQRQKADVLTRMLVAVLLSGKVKQRDDMNNISMLLADTGYFQNIAQGLTFKDGRLTVSMNILMRLAQEYAATRQIQAAA